MAILITLGAIIGMVIIGLIARKLHHNVLDEYGYNR